MQEKCLIYIEKILKVADFFLKMADQEKWQPSAAENQSPLATQLLLTPSRLDFSRDVFDLEHACTKFASHWRAN